MTSLSISIPDWRDQQWDNGAFAGTSYWLALNDYAGIGDGAGETPVFLVLDGAILSHSYNNS